MSITLKTMAKALHEMGRPDADHGGEAEVVAVDEHATIKGDGDAPAADRISGSGSESFRGAWTPAAQRKIDLARKYEHASARTSAAVVVGLVMGLSGVSLKGRGAPMNRRERRAARKGAKP